MPKYVEQRAKFVRWLRVLFKDNEVHFTETICYTKGTARRFEYNESNPAFLYLIEEEYENVPRRECTLDIFSGNPAAMHLIWLLDKPTAEYRCYDNFAVLSVNENLERIKKGERFQAEHYSNPILMPYIENLLLRNRHSINADYKLNTAAAYVSTNPAAVYLIKNFNYFMDWCELTANEAAADIILKNADHITKHTRIMDNKNLSFLIRHKKIKAFVKQNISIYHLARGYYRSNLIKNIIRTFETTELPAVMARTIKERKPFTNIIANIRNLYNCPTY